MLISAGTPRGLLSPSLPSCFNFSSEDLVLRDFFRRGLFDLDPDMVSRDLRSLCIFVPRVRSMVDGIFCEV